MTTLERRMANALCNMLIDPTSQPHCDEARECVNMFHEYRKAEHKRRRIARRRHERERMAMISMEGVDGIDRIDTASGHFAEPKWEEGE